MKDGPEVLAVIEPGSGAAWDRLADFDYDLPPELIAQEPARERDRSRLLMVDRSTGVLRDVIFGDLGEFLEPGDLLVANESRVIPARLIGRLESGGRVELLLVRPSSGGRWEVLARPARKMRVGTGIELPGGVTATVQAVGQAGNRVIAFEGTADFRAWLDSAGRMPIPPYIHRYPDDPQRYQTVYAETEGSVAAPTAGLHFTAHLMEGLRDRGIGICFITLHVGPGTFKPITDEDLRAVRLPEELGSIPEATATAIMNARASGGRVIAVGTTTTRLLEGVARSQGEITGWSGDVDLFIRPPFQFRVVDGLITNFHLPRSSLLMLVSAFASTELIRRAYAHAVTERYRFYSFGDAMLLL